ncbi:BlaI/MecI/CopY family transcriptional regulator [Cyclobacterium qasimii]|uniref:Transcriptional regulator, MecI family n=2 Tax=Cyclobacterium qasimii TaxID=1350429 RepID=S7WTY2_9BACT|nr:BlaI/MecI/CopY family transcriptional regulator [Cyclobacterium qasimii]EPR70179.1 Transcriptional regulator, MecI family [Cyclobacterium qasimii M12-11B]GEO22356.1 transcriptional regulator [Cyclobacterium qasimii]
MEKLTKKEEELMQILWNVKKAFVKDIVSEYPEPKPHYNTISSLIRVLQEKEVVGFNAFGNTYEYFPLLKKEAYRKIYMKEIVSNYFDNSFSSAVAAFVKDEHLDEEEVNELIKLIKSK